LHARSIQKLTSALRILYVQLMIYVSISPLVLAFLHETRAKTSSETSPKTGLKDFSTTVQRAAHLLCTEFIVGSFTLWSSFAFGTVFMLTQSVPIVYGTLYDWPAWKAGIIQIAVFIGEIIGLLLCIFQDIVVFERLAPRDSKQNNEPVPEARLYTSVPASFLGLAAGLFIYGWTSDPDDDYAWPIPTLGLLLIGIGIVVVGQALTTYITDCYTSQANSAVSAIAFGENTFAAFLPLAAKAMYQKLGFPWASSLLGFIGILVSCAPIVAIIFGRRIREKSRFMNKV
jgi:hypothetical protein